MITYEPITADTPWDVAVLVYGPGPCGYHVAWRMRKTGPSGPAGVWVDAWSLQPLAGEPLEYTLLHN